MKIAGGHWLSAIGCALALVACDPPRPTSGSADELTIVVQADRRELDAQEKALKQREEALKGEQSQIEKRITELASGRAAADIEHKTRLDQELERAKAAQEELGKRVVKLQQQKLQMEVQRTVLSSPGSEQGGSAVGVREAMVAAREARLSSREGSLAAREAELAAREKALVAKESSLNDRPPAIAATAVVQAKAEVEVATYREVPTRQAVEARHKKLLAEMDARGVLVSDLPGEAQPVNADVYSARKNGDYSHAADLLAELSRAVARLRIDQRFVEAKMVRLQSVRAGARLQEGQRGEVEALLREVTGSYSDGQYEKANRGLNRIAAILDASGAPG